MQRKEGGWEGRRGNQVKREKQGGASEKEGTMVEKGVIRRDKRWMRNERESSPCFSDLLG